MGYGDPRALKEQIARVRQRIHQRGVTLNPPASIEEVSAFESKHRVILPEGYRSFITALGNGGPGPVGYGILPLGRVPYMPMNLGKIWTELRDVTKPFPFTKAWVWEDGEKSVEG